MRTISVIRQIHDWSARRTLRTYWLHRCSDVVENRPLPRITFFTKPDCPLCDAAWFVVAKVAARFDVEIEKVDISATGAEAWYARYQDDIPVVHLDDAEIFRHHVCEKTLRRLIQEASSRNA